MKRRALIPVALAAWLCAVPVMAAWPPTITAIGNNGLASNASTLPIATTADAPVGSTIIVAFDISNATTPGITDTAGNTYAQAGTTCTFNTTMKLYLFWTHVTTDLPAPVTATGSITTTTVTFTTNPGTLVANQTITGFGVTAGTLITSGISQWNGTNASATVNNSQTVGPETLTVSSTIVLSNGASVRSSASAITSSDLAVSPVDITGACISSAGSTSESIATGTLSQANELIIGAVGINSTTAGYASNSPFTDNTGNSTGNPQIQWGRDVVTATTTVTYAPSWATSRANAANVWTFKQAAAAPACSGSPLLLLGVGAC